MNDKPRTPSHNEVAWWLFDNKKSPTKQQADITVSFMSETEFRALQDKINSKPIVAGV